MTQAGSATCAHNVDIAMNTKNETGGTIITTEPPETAYSSWGALKVTLEEGGE